MSNKLSIVFFGDYTNETNNPFSIMSKFISTQVVVNMVEKEKILHSFTYQIKPGHTVFLKLHYLTNLDENDTICQYADSYIIFMPLQDKEILKKIDLIINYLKEMSSYSATTYIIGNYKGEIKEEKLTKKEVENYLKKKHFQHTYLEIDENKLCEIIRKILILIYENHQANLNVEENYDKDTSRSKCIFI